MRCCSLWMTIRSAYVCSLSRLKWNGIFSQHGSLFTSLHLITLIQFYHYYSSSFFFFFLFYAHELLHYFPFFISWTKQLLTDYAHHYYNIQFRCVGTISQYCFSSDLHLVTFDEAHLQPQWLTVCADSVDVLLGDEADRAPIGMDKHWLLCILFVSFY